MISLLPSPMSDVYVLNIINVNTRKKRKNVKRFEMLMCIYICQDISTSVGDDKANIFDLQVTLQYCSNVNVI